MGMLCVLVEGRKSEERMTREEKMTRGDDKLMGIIGLIGNFQLPYYSNTLAYLGLKTQISTTILKFDLIQSIYY